MGVDIAKIDVSGIARKGMAVLISKARRESVRDPSSRRDSIGSERIRGVIIVGDTCQNSAWTREDLATLEHLEGSGEGWTG